MPHSDGGPTGLTQRRRGKFPEQFAIGTGEPPEIPETQLVANAGDRRPILTARKKKLPGLMQTQDAKVRDGREAKAPLKRGAESPFRHTVFSRQFRDGQ